jgi:hypothetical protein
VTKLGDLVHGIVLPPVKIVDKVFGTDLAHCASCGKRQEALNKFDDSVRGFLFKLKDDALNLFRPLK